MRTTAMLRAAPIVLLAACATANPASTRLADGSPRPVRQATSLRDPITEADIVRIRAASAYDAVVRLRANFLGNRGVNSFMRPLQSTRPTVFVDGMEMGTIWELRSIPGSDVREIAFLSGPDAMLRYGDGYMAGIIHVRTKR